MNLNESTVEDAALTWLGELGYTVHTGQRLRRVNRRRNGIRLAMWCWWAACAMPSGG